MNKVVEIFITGGIGSGKTTISKEICAIAGRIGFDTFVIDADAKYPAVLSQYIKRAIEKGERRVLVIKETLRPVEIRRNPNDHTISNRT